MEKELLLGAHIKFSNSTNYFLGLIQELIRVSGNVAAFFPGPPQSKLIPNLDDDNIKQAQSLAKENNIDISKFVAHSRYIINIANPLNKDNRKFGIELMIKDIGTLDKLGVGFFNFHPGSSLGQPSEIAIKFLAESINEIIAKTSNSSVVLLLETMMQKGNYIGKNFQELKSIIDLVENKKRIGVCIDTCHIWDGGYDIKNNLEKVLDEFDKVIGLNYLKAVHINDSKNDLNSNKDRHENIGQGFIGEDLFFALTTNPKLLGLPFILETPWINPKTPAYNLEIEKIKINFKKNKN